MLKFWLLIFLSLSTPLLLSEEYSELSVQYFKTEIQKLEKVTVDDLKASRLHAHYKKLLTLSGEIKQCAEDSSQTNSVKNKAETKDSETGSSNDKTGNNNDSATQQLCKQLKASLNRLKKDAIQQLNKDSFFRYKTRQRGLLNDHPDIAAAKSDVSLSLQPAITPSVYQAVNSLAFYLSIALFMVFWFVLKQVNASSNEQKEFSENRAVKQKQITYALILLFGFISFITHWLMDSSDVNSQTGYWQGFIITSMLFLGFENRFSWKSFTRLIVSYAFAATSLIYLLNFEVTGELPQPLIMDTLFIIAWLVVLLTLTANLSTKVWLGFVTGSVLILTIDSIGFHQLAHQILLTAVTINIIWLIGRLIKKSVPLFVEQLSEFLQQLRQKLLNDNSREPLPGFPWVKWGLIGAGILFVLILMIPYLGLPLHVSDQIINGITHGFDIGSISLSLLAIVYGISIFGLLLVLSKFLQIKIESRAHKSLQPTKGSSEALAAIFWYSAVVTSGLIGLSIAGFSVQNLALIAGAFSIGIGFGLQNIVSNFVSGLILLIERPIKRGDWIVIGNTEGFVKNVNIRATEIQTFDRADIIVPNSDLLTNQVTNWMLNDSIGRIKLMVGVAYGSDSDKVENVLSDITKQHPDLITDDPQYPCQILFWEFGESSLNFEIRAFLKDIATINRVRSELNFQIDAAFRQHNIEIPFPQRDLHIRSDATRSQNNDRD